MSEDKKAKILLEHKSYENFLKRVLNTKEESIIEEFKIMMSEHFYELVESSNVKEELLELESNEINQQDLDECDFESWEEAWDCYSEIVKESTVEFIVKNYELKFMRDEIEKLVEDAYGEIIF